MSFLLIQGMAMTQSLRDIWREQGAVLVRRGRSIEDIYQLARRTYPEFILNLGRRWEELGVEEDFPIFNDPYTIYPISNPARLRDMMPEFLPPTPMRFPADCWFKLHGFGGTGKRRFVAEQMPQTNGVADVQLHIEGQEYRVITVGHKVVQVHARFGPNGERTYEWRGLTNTPPNVKERAREAARKLHSKRSVIGWDLIDNGEEVFVLEGNTCPGVNAATAERIVKEIRKQLEGA